MNRTALLRRAAAGAAVALLAGACGTAGGVVHTLAAVPTKSQISSAYHAVTSLPGVDVTLHLDATAAQIQAADPAGGASARDAALLAGSDIRLVIVNGAGGTLEDLKTHPQDAQFEFRTDVGGGPVLDLRYVSKVLYGRADVQKIISTAGADPAAELPKIEAQIPPDPALKFVTDFLNSRWVSLDLNQLKGLTQQFRNDPQLKQMFSALGTTSVTQPSKSTLDRIRSAIGSAFDRDISVSRNGSDPTLGSRFVVSAPARKLLSDFVGSMSGILPALLQQQLPKAVSSVPDKTVTSEVFVKDGVLRALKLDLAQFDSKIPASVGPLYLEADFVPTTANVEVPSPATPIDLKAAIAAFMRMIGGQAASASSGAFGM